MSGRESCRAGYTLRELLACVTILGLLLGLLPAWLNQGSVPNRGNICRNNLRNLSLGVIVRESKQRRYPGYLQHLGTDSRGTYEKSDDVRTQRNWQFTILPQLERNDIYEHYLHADASVVGAQPTQTMEIFICPSDVTNDSDGDPPPSSYVANTGLPDVPPFRPGDPPADWPGNGVFHDLREFLADDGTPLTTTRVSADYVRSGDGLTHTMLLTENVDAVSWTTLPYGDLERQLGCVWVATVAGQPPSPGPPPANRINQQIGTDEKLLSVAHARPSSKHAGGVNMAFCDASVRFVSEEIDYSVYCRLLSPNGAEARAAGVPEDEPQGRLHALFAAPLDVDDLP